MDMRKVVEDRLYNLTKDEAAVTNMRDEIRSLEMEFGAIRAARTDGDPVSGGGNGRSEWMDNNIERRNYLRQRSDAAEIRTKSLRGAISVLSREQQFIVDVFFLRDMSKPEEYLEGKLHCDRSTVFRKRRMAVSDLARILYGGNEV